MGFLYPHTCQIFRQSHRVQGTGIFAFEENSTGIKCDFSTKSIHVIAIPLTHRSGVKHGVICTEINANTCCKIPRERDKEGGRERDELKALIDSILIITHSSNHHELAILLSARFGKLLSQTCVLEFYMHKHVRIW